MARVGPKPRTLVDALRARDAGRVQSALDAWPAERPLPAAATLEAARRGWTAALELLHRRGADLDAPYRNYRPLHALIQERPHGAGEPLEAERLRCLRWLLEHGADPELPGAWPPARAILVAAFAGEPSHVEVLREAGATVDGFVLAALGNARAVLEVLDADAGLARQRDGDGLTALHCCAASRMGGTSRSVARDLLAIGERLLERGADPNARVRGYGRELDACYFAANSRQEPLFELLLRNGADATAALPSALSQGQLHLAQAALTHGADVDRATDSGKPLLNDLIRWGQVRPALWLLEHGASPNVADDRGWTAVHQAASRGNVRLMRAVLEHGGDLQRRDGEGFTPLDIARPAWRPQIETWLAGSAGQPDDRGSSS